MLTAKTPLSGLEPKYLITFWIHPRNCPGPSWPASLKLHPATFPNLLFLQNFPLWCMRSRIHNSSSQKPAHAPVIDCHTILSPCPSDMSRWAPQPLHSLPDIKFVPLPSTKLPAIAYTVTTEIFSIKTQKWSVSPSLTFSSGLLLPGRSNPISYKVLHDAIHAHLTNLISCFSNHLMVPSSSTPATQALPSAVVPVLDTVMQSLSTCVYTRETILPTLPSPTLPHWLAFKTQLQVHFLGKTTGSQDQETFSSLLGLVFPWHLTQEELAP